MMKVINNAGIVSRGMFVDTPVSEARKLLEVNYLGAYNVTQVSPVGCPVMQSADYVIYAAPHGNAHVEN